MKTGVATTRTDRLASKYLRLAKYAVVSPVIGLIVRYSSFLDGTNGAPPVTLNYGADGDFIKQGDTIVAAIGRDVPLDETTRVLDIGCGIGRIATAFARQNRIGLYRGFDVVRYGILWCRKAIRDPRYRFDYANIRNDFYNPFGGVEPEDYTFPYEERSFDLAVAISVFTHLPESQTRRYFAEAMRCLDTGGRAYFTTFLAENRQPGARFSLAHSMGEALVERLEEPDLAVGYSRAFWEKLAAEHDAVIETVHDGSWSGRKGLRDFQDVLIFRKTG